MHLDVRRSRWKHLKVSYLITYLTPVTLICIRMLVREGVNIITHNSTSIQRVQHFIGLVHYYLRYYLLSFLVVFLFLTSPFSLWFFLLSLPEVNSKPNINSGFHIVLLLLWTKDVRLIKKEVSRSLQASTVLFFTASFGAEPYYVICHVLSVATAPVQTATELLWSVQNRNVYICTTAAKVPSYAERPAIHKTALNPGGKRFRTCQHYRLGNVRVAVNGLLMERWVKKE